VAQLGLDVDTWILISKICNHRTVRDSGPRISLRKMRRASQLTVPRPKPLRPAHHGEAPLPSDTRQPDHRRYSSTYLDGQWIFTPKLSGWDPPFPPETPVPGQCGLDIQCRL